MIAQKSSQRKVKGQTSRQKIYGWSVVSADDDFGVGFVAQPTAENRKAMAEGWKVECDGLRLDEACRIRDRLSDEAYAQTVDFDFGHLYTEEDDDPECADCGFDLRHGAHQQLQPFSWESPGYFCNGAQVEVGVSHD